MTEVMGISLLLDKQQIALFCRRHAIKELALFGSVLRDDFGPDSDVDVVVQFQAGKSPGFFALIEMQEELSLLIGGHIVDLRTPKDLSRYFRDEVMESAEIQYAEG